MAVLVYHDVHPRPDTPFVVTPERLAADLRWFLDNGWQPLTLDRFADWMRGELYLAGDWFLLTFDDGYRGWAEHGYPVLRRLRVPAIQFVRTGRLGYEGGPGGRPTITAHQVTAMAAGGLVVFGCHSYDLHRKVAGRPRVELVSEAEVAEDLDRSRGILKELTAMEPLALAWPYGASTPAAHKVAAGRYDLIFLATDGFVHRGEPHAIPRFGMEWRSREQMKVLFAAH